MREVRLKVGGEVRVLGVQVDYGGWWVGRLACGLFDWICFHIHSLFFSEFLSFSWGPVLHGSGVLSEHVISTSVCRTMHNGDSN